MTERETLWPNVPREARPWTRWWWLGNAVDKPNITRLLEEYARAGLGGVEITPIYGVQGEEARDIAYLSPAWMEMLRHTLAEAERLDLGVDMVTGTGWPFGGPWVTDADAEDKLVIAKVALAGGQPFARVFGPSRPQALTAVSASGQTVPLLNQLTADNQLTWTPPLGDWTLYIVTQKWAGRSVKRAAPGGEGKCINPFSRQSLTRYLEPFNTALADLPSGALRCHFHDSFEYLADWSPTLLDEFQARRGYDLREHINALAGDGDPDVSARVRTDYRETISDLLLENFTQTWTDWAHKNGSLSRNQAHGSPGNLLDVYGVPDIPETEIFGGAGDPRANKFASSAAHVLGKPLTSSESCTWLGEHFTVSLADCKAALDQLLLAGINHVFYHGTPYSPSDAAWPGWLFYASTTFAPDDPLWRDFPTLNAYITRCQFVLQSGRPDNDILLYWPLHDLWQTRPNAFMLEINGHWLTEQPVGKTAQTLWDAGYAFDYVSDRQLALAQVGEGGGIEMPGGRYQVIVVPPCVFMPEQTLGALLGLAESGATVIFEGGLPTDVPGQHALTERRQRFQSLLSGLTWREDSGLRQATVGTGRLLCGPDITRLLIATSVRPEIASESPGLRSIRRRDADGGFYFLVNTGPKTIDDWVGLSAPFQSATLMNPMTGETGAAQIRGSDVYLQLPPGASVIVRTLTAGESVGPDWRYFHADGESITLPSPWQVAFIAGGPELPPPFETETLGSWTEHGDAAERFAGTVRYTTTFDALKSHADTWRLDLGHICESARVRLNGQELGTLIAPPFQVTLGQLQRTGNVLEIEVTNLAANRIRDMDRRELPWKIFREINFVGIDYKPF
ncbi:MAG: hypothetical protein M3Y28_07265, partial [Armatimonadota bacterium]|nr:hypothetical protein [Armatimonadota bacterium]